MHKVALENAERPLTAVCAYAILLPKLVSYLGTLKTPPQLRGTVLQVLAAPGQRKGSLLIPTEAKRYNAWPFFH
jgi:hypothetical protein